MKFMIMVFGDRAGLHAKPTEWIERMVAFMVRLDDELARSGELVYSEVLERGDSATTVEPGLDIRRGGHSDAPLSRYWVVKVPGQARAVEIASSIAEIVDAPVEVRRCMEQSLKP